MLKKRISRVTLLALSLAPVLSQAGTLPITINLVNPTTPPTTVYIGQTMYLNYLVTLNAAVPNPVTMTALGSMPSGMAVMSNMSPGCGVMPGTAHAYYPMCATGFQLNPGPMGACCLVVQVDNPSTNTVQSQVTLAPSIQTNPAAYQAKATPINITMSNLQSTPAMLMVTPVLSATTPIASLPTTLVAGGALHFTVKNIGQADATNIIGAFVPLTTDVTITGCGGSLGNNLTCDLLVSSGSINDANLPAFLTVTAITNGQPITATAPSMTATQMAAAGINGLVYSTTGGVKSIANVASGITLPWGSWIPGNASTKNTDGTANTLDIVNQNGGTGTQDRSFAAGYCYNLGGNASGWYLPAACQMGTTGENVGCAPGFDNIETNLYNAGFLQTMNSTNVGYWTSSSVGAGHSPFAYYQIYNGSYSNMLWGDVTDPNTNNRNVICVHNL